MNWETGYIRKWSRSGFTFLGLGENFLHCNIGSIPLKYLGHSIGVNSRSLSIWQPLLDILINRLSSWSNKFVNFGRVILLNLVLNFIMIFFLSFLKMLKDVCRSKGEVGYQRSHPGKSCPFREVALEADQGGGIVEINYSNFIC